MHDVEHAVEARIAHNGHLGHANGGKEFARTFVLHEEMGYAFQTACIIAAVPAEEYLVGAEDARHAVNGNAMLVEHFDIVAPELVLDEIGCLGARHADELAGIECGVEGEITHHICSLVVLAHFVTRGGEEGEQDFLFGMFASEALHEGTPLLKFA